MMVAAPGTTVKNKHKKNTVINNQQFVYVTFICVAKA